MFGSKEDEFLTGFMFHSGLGFLLKLITLRKRLRRKLGLLALGKILKLILLKMINAKLEHSGTFLLASWIILVLEVFLK